MRGRGIRAFVGAQVVLATALLAAPAAAAPADFPHGTVEHRFTTTAPGAPSGFTYAARYHAAGDPDARPPYMRRMIFYNESGVSYDTSVPDRCTASDIELALRGAAACPAGSRLGGGESETAFDGGPVQRVQLDFFNNTDEQIILARSPVVTSVARGRIHPDGSVEFASPTCWPTVGPVGCPVDNVLQIASTMNVPAYTRTAADGSTRSWLTTPAACPDSGAWRDTIRFWWADGSEDSVAIQNPCALRPEAKIADDRLTGRASDRRHGR